MNSKENRRGLSGSKGEHEVQEKFGNRKRADAFYNNQMLDYLNPLMEKFISQQEMVFISTSDSKGECDSSFRAGEAGFVQVLNNRKIALPEYRGNGVMASLGNILENPHIGMIFIDFFGSRIGLHVNGRASIIENQRLLNKGNIPAQMVEEAKRREGVNLSAGLLLMWRKHIFIVRNMFQNSISEIRISCGEPMMKRRKKATFSKPKGCPYTQS